MRRLFIISLALCIGSRLQAQPDCGPGDTYPFIFCPNNVVHCSEHPCSDPPPNQVVKAPTLPGCVNISGMPSGDMLKQPTLPPPGPDPDPEPASPGPTPSDPGGSGCDHTQWAADDANWTTEPSKPTVPDIPNPDDYITDLYPDGTDNPDYQTALSDYNCKNDELTQWRTDDGWWTTHEKPYLDWQSDHAAHDNWVTQQNDVIGSTKQVFDPSQANNDANTARLDWLGACPGKSTDPTCCIYIVFSTDPQDFDHNPLEDGNTQLPQCGQTGCLPQRTIRVNISDQKIFYDFDNPGNTTSNQGYIDPSTGNVINYPYYMYYTGNPSTGGTAPTGQYSKYHTESFFRLMEHEMGHWFGLKHIDLYPCSQNPSIMWSTALTKDKDPEPPHPADLCMFEKLYCDPTCPLGVATKNNQPMPLKVIVQPNPSTGAADALYSIEDESNVQISIYDLLGREIIQVFSGNQAPGEYKIPLFTQYLSSGTYYCKVKIKNNEAVAKFTLTK